MRALLIIFISLLLIGCAKNVYVPVKSSNTEYIEKHTRDSIFVKDSIYIHDKGDSIIIEKWNTKYIERLKYDSITIKDTVYVPYPVKEIVEVEKKLTKWQKIKLELGGLLLGFVSIGLIVGVIWFFKRK